VYKRQEGEREGSSLDTKISLILIGMLIGIVITLALTYEEEVTTEIMWRSSYYYNWLPPNGAYDLELYANWGVPRASCEGIEAFFTNTSFLNDMGDMTRAYNKAYNNEERGRGILPPLAILNGSKGYDCDDYAFAIQCLAKKYSITCFYFEREDGRHLGSCCYLPELREFRCI